MRRGLLASVRGVSYIAATAVVALAAACRPGAVAPAGTFAAASREREILRIRWRSDDGRITLSGAGAARVQPPDSMRVDLALRLGVARATVVLAGETVAAEPREVVERLLPDRFALWALLGAVRLPDTLIAAEHLADAAGVALWRFTDGRGRATTYRLRGDTLVGVTRERDGRVTAQLALWRDADGRIRRAQLTDVLHGARFEVDITAREPSEPFDPQIWRLRP